MLGNVADTLPAIPELEEVAGEGAALPDSADMEVDLEEAAGLGEAAAVPDAAEEAGVPDLAHSEPLDEQRRQLHLLQAGPGLREAEAEVDLMFLKSFKYYIGMLNCINLDTCCVVCKPYAVLPHLEPADRKQLDQIHSDYCWCDFHDTNDKQQDEFFEALLQEPSPKSREHN